MLKLISFKKPYFYLIISAVLFVLLSIFTSLPSLSAPFCAMGVDSDRCNSKVPNWVQSCGNCDADPDSEWCNTTDCAVSGKVCVSGACQTPSQCTDSDSDGYGVCPNCGVANGCTNDGNDCDDNDNSINPGATEICGNGKDDDCVGGDLVCSTLAASIVSPINLAVFKIGDTVSFNSSVSGGVSPYTYLWQYTSKICGATCAPPLFLIGSSPSVTKNDFNQGGYRIFLKVTDAIGSMAYTPVDPAIGIGGGPIIDICDLPTSSITSPVNGTVFEELDTINFNGVFSTCFNSYSSVEWKSNINGLLASSSSVTLVWGPPPSYSSSFSTHNLSIGVHNITFTVADSIGSVVKSINITVTPPASVKTLILSPQNNAPFSNGEAVVFDSQTVGGVSPYVYSWNSNVDGNIGNLKTFSKNNLSVGNHTITLTVTDQQGKTGVNSVNIYIASSSFDWRNKNGQNWMTSVKNQDGLGSCGSFAKIGVVEAKYNIQENNPALDKNLSEQDLINCSGLPGTWTYLKNAGVAEEPCVSYKQAVGPCPAVCDDGTSKKLWKITDSFLTSQAGIAQIKYDLINHGPLHVGINITTWNSLTYTCSSTNEEHYVVLVGYDDVQGVWIAKNSWGATWNTNGYFKIKYGNCGLEKYHERVGNVIPPTPSAAISPFGIMAAFEPSSLSTISASDKVAWAGEKFRNLGAKWSRSVGETIIWVIIEPEISKGYDWSNSDEVLKKAYEVGGENFNMVVVISPQRFKGDNPDILPDEENYYSKFVEELVERYDGDGINDYDSIIKVKYWQMENEPFPVQWENRGGTVDGYVRFAELTHNAIKKSDSNAKIILGTLQFSTAEEVDEFKEVISKMKNKTLFDYVDTHYWGAGNNYKIPISDARSVLDSNGYSNAKMVALESGTTVTLKGTTEKDQANYLIKEYAYNLAHDFSLINWNNLVEWNNFGGNPNSIYNYMGLIADGANGDSIPAGTPRLSYYTYKKMTETLEGSDWNNIQTIQESGGIYIYKFTKNGKPIWVAWNDNLGSQGIIISGISSSQVKITEAIPKYESGEEVTDYNSAFNTGTKSVTGSSVSITLGDKPVFVEEK